MLNIGKLYRSEYYLLLYPDKKTAAAAGLRWALDVHGVARQPVVHVAYWSRELGKPVSYCNPETPLLVLFVNEKYVEVLAGDKQGWIINIDWLKLEEIR